MSLDFRNLNTLWASILVETLARLGLTYAIISPGSRSSPLTLAFAHHPTIEAIPVLDERSAAFFALGLGKKQGIPVVLVCTSGTAGANYFPAVIEAKESRVPLLILTADRPLELRSCHAGQTIEQTHLYGHYPNWYSELTTPEFELLPYLRQTLLQAWSRCLFPTPGVVHLNIPLGEPLAPLPDGTQNYAAHFDLNNFFAHLVPPTFPRYLSPCQDLAPTRGIIIAGVTPSLHPLNYSRAIANLAQALGFPVLAEALSPVRNYAALNPYLVCTYDAILRHSSLRESLRPEIIIQCGDLPTSKELRQWLKQQECPRIVVDSSPENLDPLHGFTTYLRFSVEDLTNSLPQLPPPSDPTHLNTWLELEQKIQKQIYTTFEPITDLIEAKVPYLLSQFLPPDTPVFIANSMPVRNAEFFWLPNNLHLIPYFNRGANGIDGTLATALGIAHQNQPTVLLTGDLALLHDTNGFLLKKYLQGSLTIILINNSGGGIFETLPISQFNPVFEEFFATPQEIDFCQLCQTYQIEYHLIKSWAELCGYLNPLPPQGIRLLEITTDRKKDTAWLKETLINLARNLC